MRLSLSSLLLLGITGAVVWDVVTAPPGKSFLTFLISRMMLNVPATSTPKTEVDSTPRPTLVKMLQESAKLITTEVHLERVVPVSQKTTLPFFGEIERAKLVLIAKGKVGVGVDLRKIEDKDIQEIDSIIKISIPPPKVQYTELTESKVYDQNHDILVSSDNLTNLREVAEAEAKKKFQEVATSCEVYRKAEAEAQQFLVGLFNKIGEKRTVKIVPSNNQDCIPVSE